MTLFRQQNRWVLGAATLTDSAWVFAAAALAGFVLEHNASPMSWTAVLTIIASSVVVGRLAPYEVAAVEVVNLVRALIGAVLIYVVIGTQITLGSNFIDLLWPVRLGSDAMPDGYAFVGIAGSVIGAFLWWKGTRLAAAEFPIESLTLSFRLGVTVVGFGMILDAMHSADFGMFPIMFIFFAAGLGGLTIGHLMPESKQSAKAMTWPRVVTGVVAVVVAAGLIFSLFRRDLLSFISDPLATGLGNVAQGIFWGIVGPIAIALDAFTNAVISFFDRPFEPDAGGGGARAGEGELLPAGPGQLSAIGAEEEEEQASSALDLVIQIVEWVFIAIVLLVLLYILIRLLLRYARLKPASTAGLRESVLEDADVMSDSARLLLKLIPDRLLRAKPRAFQPPEGPPGIVEVFRIYYRLLKIAADKGLRREPHQSATEFQSTLEQLLPRDLVRTVTHAFNRACYGHHPATPEQIGMMRSALSSLALRPG